MKTVKYNNGETATVTTRTAEILIAKGEAVEVTEIQTKEEKIVNKGGRPKKNK